jgi:exonuclease III
MFVPLLGALVVSRVTCSLSFFSWNVRGLGQDCRCEDVLAELISVCPTFAAIQETKLSSLDSKKKNTFLPTRLLQFAMCPSVGAAGGILSAWDDSVCSLLTSNERAFTLTYPFALLSNGCAFSVTNVYAPTDHADKASFLDELSSIASSMGGP